jgi:hypothetical protein
MELYSQTATDEAGNVVNGSSVSVTIASSGLPATIYDKDGVALSNPFLTGYDRSRGEVEFQAANGLYNITVPGNPGASKKNQALFDPTDGLSPTWSGNGIYNGKMTISQRGDYTTPVSATTNSYYLDRWKSFVIGVTANVEDTGNALKYTATSTTSGRLGARQLVEDFDRYNNGLVKTFSAKVTSNSSNARIGVFTGTVWVMGDAHTGGGSEEILSVTLTSTLTAANEPSIVIMNASGGNVSITTGDYIEFTDVRLDLGSHRLSGDREYGEEKRLCKQYFRKQAFYVPATTAQTLGIIDMRATPTITGGGSGFTSTGTTADTLIAYQTSGGVQTLELTAEL